MFSDYMAVSEGLVARSVKVPTEEVVKGLERLSKLRILDYLPTSESPQITFLTPRQDAGKLQIDRRKMEERRALNLAKMESMISYAEQTVQCRMQFIQSYFGEDTDSTCGICDVCIARRKKLEKSEWSDVEKQVRFFLKQKPMTVEELEAKVDPEDHALFLEVIREMVDRSAISYDDYWVLSLKAGT